jgi:hypothetical protein
VIPAVALWEVGVFALDFWAIRNVEGGHQFLLLLLVPPFFFLQDYWHIEVEARRLFWFHFAQSRKWSYHFMGDPDAERAVFFRQGDRREMSNLVEGSFEGKPFRIFEFSITFDSDKSKRTYTHTVFEFKFSGQFPHLYLDRKGNLYGVSVGERIPLLHQFAKFFHLFGPSQYEIEALQIFTPDVLERILKMGLMHDIELVEQELLIFMEGEIKNLEHLESEYTRAITLYRLFAPKLDKFKFTPIGSLPHTF